MNQQIEILKGFNFSLERLQMLKKLNEQNTEQMNLKKLLFIVSLGEQTIADELYIPLIKKINECYNIFDKLKIIINIFDSYYSNEEKNTVIQYNQILKEIKENQISMFPDELNISKFKPNFEKASKIYKLKSSKIFVQMFEYYRKMNEDKGGDSITVNQTISSFKNLANLFNEQKEGNININELEEVLAKIDEKEIVDEIDKIVEIFKIKKNFKKAQISMKLKLLKKRKKNYEILRKINLLLNDFNFAQKEIKNKLKKS